MAFIIRPIPADTAEAIKIKIRGLIVELESYVVNVPAQNKIGVQTMAEGREGYVRLVDKVAQENEQYLSKVDNAADLTDKLRADSDWEGIRQSTIKITEMVTDTQWANSADIMETSTRFTTSLNGQRKNNSALDSSMGEIDEWNKRYDRNPPKEAATPPTPPTID